MNSLSKVKKKDQRKTRTNKLNGFSLFAIEFAGRKVVQDKNIHITQQEISNAHTMWDEMTADKREQYKDRAKQYNVRVESARQIYNSLGQKVTHVETERLKLEEEKNRRQNEIERIIKDAADVSDLDRKVFVFVSTSHFYDDPQQIYPAEIAFVKYSLKKGAFGSMSIEIDPGDLPIGSAFQADAHASRTHKYPLPPESVGEKDYLKILTKIIDFLPQDEELPIFFADGYEDDPTTEHQLLKNTRRTLKLIFEQGGEYDVARSLKIYSIIELFYYLRNTTTELLNSHDPDSSEIPFMSFWEAKSRFMSTDSEFRYNTDACVYHENAEAVSHCCLNKVLRFAYVISKWCAHGFKYQLKPGFHFPKGYAVV